MSARPVHSLLVDDDVVDVMAIQRAFKNQRIANPMITVKDGGVGYTEDYPLERLLRDATNLIGHRNGPDRQPGTSDDDRFDTIEEVDDIKYVGPAALRRLIEFSHANGFVPHGDEPLGIFDGVTFTIAQAEATLALVNEESDGVLRIEIGLVNLRPRPTTRSCTAPRSGAALVAPRRSRRRGPRGERRRPLR